jgi:hypothetical protein
MNAFNGQAIFLVGDKMIGDMYPPDYQDMAFRLNFSSNFRSQMLITGVYLARLQRAPEGADESTPGRGDNVIDSRRMRLIYFVCRHAVVFRDCPMDSKMNRLRFGRHVSEPGWSSYSVDANICDVYDFRHHQLLFLMVA